MSNPAANSFGSGSRFEDGYKSGLVVSVLSNTTLSLSSGSCLDSTLSTNATLSEVVTINAAVVGANGIDAGSLAASKIYAVYHIWNSLDSGVAKAGLISLSTTDPTLPAPNGRIKYDSFRRVGWAFTDGSSHFRILYAYGDGRNVEYTFDTPVSVLSAGNATTATAVTLDQLCPAINKIPIKLACAFTPGAASRTLTVLPSGSAGTSRDIITGQVTSVIVTQKVLTNALLISGVPKFDYLVSNSGDAATVYMAGFTDNV